MSFLQKLGKFARDFVEAFPSEAEREPTIAEDYPEKWSEIQRKRLMMKITRIVILGVLVLLIIARIWLGVVEINQLYKSTWPLVPIIAPLVLIFILYSTNKFECPRCHKIFQSYSRYDFLNDPKARCQHCGLKMGEPSERKPVR